MSVKHYVSEELMSLHAELRHLKGCQLRYFSLTVLSAGIILGAKGVFQKPYPITFLAPLAVIIPCWLIFFDKATSITRITAYVRLLESILLGKRPEADYVGFENALKMFRATEDKESKLIPKIKFSDLKLEDYVNRLSPNTRHRYWTLHWWTFTILASICSILPFFLGIGFNPFYSPLALVPWVCIVAVTLSALFTLHVLINLGKCGENENVIHGKFSYDAMEKLWEKVFQTSI